MPLVPQRLLPDADDVARDVLLTSGVPVMANTPANLLDLLPAVVVRRFGGAAVHSALLDRATVAVDAYAGTRREAADLAETCRVLLYRAWREQTIHAGASVAKFNEIASPSELRGDGQPDQLYRFNATYSLHLRP